MKLDKNVFSLFIFLFAFIYEDSSYALASCPTVVNCEGRDLKNCSVHNIAGENVKWGVWAVSFPEALEDKHLLALHFKATDIKTDTTISYCIYKLSNSNLSIGLLECVKENACDDSPIVMKFKSASVQSGKFQPVKIVH